MEITVELSGGLELLFDGQRELKCSFNGTQQVTVLDVMRHCRDHLLVERPELFMKGDTVRPGVLVLINDCDWELCDKEKTQLTSGDRLAFVSTLHGG